MAAGPDRSNAWDGVGVGWAVTSTLIAGILVCGGAGWGLDLLVGTHRLFLAVGMVIGAAAGTYLVYLKYGKEP